MKSKLSFPWKWPLALQVEAKDEPQVPFQLTVTIGLRVGLRKPTKIGAKRAEEKKKKTLFQL